MSQSQTFADSGRGPQSAHPPHIDHPITLNEAFAEFERRGGHIVIDGRATSDRSRIPELFAAAKWSHDGKTLDKPLKWSPPEGGGTVADRLMLFDRVRLLAEAADVNFHDVEASDVELAEVIARLRGYDHLGCVVTSNLHPNFEARNKKVPLPLHAGEMVEEAEAPPKSLRK